MTSEEYMEELNHTVYVHDITQYTENHGAKFDDLGNCHHSYTSITGAEKKRLQSLNQKVRLAESKYRCTIKVKSLLHLVIRKLTSFEQKVLV